MATVADVTAPCDVTDRREPTVTVWSHDRTQATSVWSRDTWHVTLVTGHVY